MGAGPVDRWSRALALHCWRWCQRATTKALPQHRSDWLMDFKEMVTGAVSHTTPPISGSNFLPEVRSGEVWAKLPAAVSNKTKCIMWPEQQRLPASVQHVRLRTPSGSKVNLTSAPPTAWRRRHRFSSGAQRRPAELNPSPTPTPELCRDFFIVSEVQVSPNVLKSLSEIRSSPTDALPSSRRYENQLIGWFTARNASLTNRFQAHKLQMNSDQHLDASNRHWFLNIWGKSVPTWSCRCVSMLDVVRLLHLDRGAAFSERRGTW